MKNKRLKIIVDDILKNNPLTRSDDALLVYKVWQRFMKEQGEVLNPSIYSMIKNYFPDTITRTRRKLNQEGIYLPPKEIQIKRNRNEISHRFDYNKKVDKQLPIWTSSSGEEILVSEMPTGYIVNAKAYLIKQLEELNHAPPNDSLMFNEHIDFMYSWIEIFDKELNKRNNN